MNTTGEWVFAAVIAPYLAALVVVLIHRAKWYAVAWTGVAGIAVSAIASILAFISASGGYAEGFRVEWLPSLGVEFSLRADFLSLVMGIVVSWLSLLIAIYSVEYVGAWNAVWYWFFFSFFVGSMQLLVYANDLFALLAGWEGTGLASYALISFYYDDRESDWVGDPGRRALGVPMWSPPTHSGIRAIVFTRFADGGTLIGIGLIHGILGTTSMAVMEHLVSSVIGYTVDKNILIPFIVAFYLGALAKSAQFPFHEWLVTAMTGPAPVSALIHAATMVKAGVYFALRFTPWIVMGAAVVGVLAEAGIVYNWFLWIALLTAFATATMAVAARELKLIWAYSTASQLSYMFAAVFGAAVGASAYALAVTAAEPAEHMVIGGVFGGLSHLISHAVFKAALFLTAGALIHAVHSRYITDMGGLRGAMPYTFIAALLAGLSLAAIPPFSGWWSKDSVVVAISMAGWPAATAALVTATVTAAYTIRALVYIFSTKPTGREAHGHEPGWLMRGPYIFLGLASIVLGLVWPFIMEPGVAEGLGFHPETSLATMAWGTAAALIGAGLGSLYLAGWKPWNTINRSMFLKGLHTFLYDRWFINALIYRIFVYPGEKLAHILRDYMEYAIDSTYHIIIPASVRGVGFSARNIHNGDLSRYLALLVIGIIFSIVIAYYVILAYAFPG